MIDNIKISNEVPPPSVRIDYPEEGATMEPDFDLTFTISNWPMSQGDKHLHWFVDGVDQGARYDTSPIPIRGLSYDQHTISLKLANADHSFTGVEAAVTFIVQRQGIGDIDQDGDVDGFDLTLFLENGNLEDLPDFAFNFGLQEYFK